MQLRQRLLEAASRGDVRQVAALLPAGADPNLREDDGHGRTATEWAAAGDHRRTLELLLAADPAPALHPSETRR